MRSLVKGAAVLGGILVLIGLSATGAALAPYDILIVDDGHMLRDTPVKQGSSLDRHFAELYKDAIISQIPAARIDYFNTSALGYGPSRDRMNDYDLVVWYTLGDIAPTPTCPDSGSLIDSDKACTTLFGDEDNPMTGGGDIENVTKYIRKDRGRLLLTGQQLNKDIGNSAFLNNVLASNYTPNSMLKPCDGEGSQCSDSDFTKSDLGLNVTGQVIGPVVEGSSDEMKMNTTTEKKDWRDVIYETVGDDGDGEGDGFVRENLYWNTPGNSGTPGVDFDDDGIAEELAHSMIRVSNTSSKLLNFAIGLEAMQPDKRRQKVIGRGINFLLGPRSDDTDVVDERKVTKVGEAGSFTVNGSTWKNVTFQNEYNTPIVVGTVNSEGSLEPLVVSVRNVHSTWAEMRVCEVEASNYDNKCVSHSPTPEEVGYLVVDASKTDRIDGIDAGRFRIGGRIRSTNRTIQFTESMGSDPVMLGTLQTVNGEVPTVPRFIDTGSSFVAGICHASTSDEDVCEAGHANETVGWVALEQGNLPFFQQDAAGRQEIGSNAWTNFDYSTFNAFDLDDSFERQNLNGGWSKSVPTGGDVSVSTDCGATVGSRSLKISGGANAYTIVNSASYDLSGRSRVRIAFDVKQGGGSSGCDDPEKNDVNGDENFAVQYYDQSGTWQTINVFLAGGSNPAKENWREVVFTLPPAALHSSFKIRFVGYPNDAGDYWAVDDVELGTGPVALSELQTRNDGQELLTTRAIGATNELNAKFCESDGGEGCEGHLAETIGWAAVPAGTLKAYLRGYPAYTDNRVNVNAICRNYQVNPRTAIRNAKFFVEGTTGIPANHRATTAGDGTNMTLERLYGLSWLQNATYFDYDAAGNLSTNDPRGVNSTFAVQCQDSNTPFNYWGPFEKDWLVTDTKAPITGSGFDFASDNLEFGENYTNTPEHDLTVKFGVLPRYNPDLVRFSCQRDGPWTNWRFYNYTQESQTYRFDLTSPLNGCQPTDRNVTVHAQIRDFANNTASQLATDWIVLDRNDPSATSLEPQNRYINLTDLIRINGTDDRALSVGLEAPNNTFSTDALYDGFEDGNDDKWTAQYDCGWGVQTQHAIGQYSVEMGDGNSYIVRSLDISDLQDVKVTYYGDTSSMDSSGENGYAEWWDGVSWHTLVTHHNDPFGKHVADIPSSWIDQGGNNKIRFRLDGSDCGDHFYVDEIAVQNQVNGTFIANVSFNPGYNYSFAESGSTQLTSWLYDRASNLALNTFDLFVDVRSPAVDQITTNASYIRPEKNISVNVSDDQSFGFMRLNNGTETTQFTSTSVSYEPGWTQEIWKNLTLRMNDSAGNPTVRRYWYYIDGTPPTLDTISDSNTSYINDSILTVTAFDTRAGLGTLYQYNGNRNETFTSGNSFDADWSGEGTKPLTLFLFDKAGNLFKQYYEFTLDTTDPSASTNHSFPPPGAVNGWIGHDLAVGINATDNFQTDYIRYCTGASTCTPDKLSGQGLNVSTTVSCPAGSTCVKYVRFRANDSAGNNYPTPTSAATSDNVSIDKEVEEITFENPSDGGEATGVVDLRTFIDDSNGVGLQDANYSVVNKSNGVIYQSGDLNVSKDWDAVWNSSEDVPVTHRVTFNVTAEDLLGNTRSENITFRVSNAGVTNTISQPAATYVTADFDLLVTAKRPGIPKLANHTYFIFNESTGSVVNYSQVTGLDTSEHAFNFTVDTGSWSNDGNYSINSTAFDNESERSIDESWFYLDREDPTADVAGITNKSWQRGIIDVGYTALDAVKNGSCYWRFNDEGSWSTNNSLSCGTGTFRFDTSNCNDDSTADCRLQVIAEDAAGNLKRDSVYIKVDNSPPNVSFVAPPKASWQNSDFDVKRNDEDSTVKKRKLTCQWRNGTGSWIDVSGSCDGNFSVDISTYCSQEGDTECEIEIRTRNPAGWTVKKTRLFSIDTRSPNVGSVDPLPSEEPVINGSRNFTVTFSDPTPGSGVQYAFRNNGTRKEALSSGVEFDPDWEDNGQETLSFALNDSADNLVTRSYTFDVDVSPPQFTGPRFNVSYDTSFNGYRIYPGQPITFKVNVTDNYEINTVTATLNTSSNGVDGKNITMSRTTGNTTDGVWEFEYTDTGSVGTYNVTALYLTDAVSNRNASADMPSFKVVRYGLNASLGGDRRIAAGHEEQVVLDLALNRSLTDPVVRVFVPPSSPGSLEEPSFVNTSAFTCSFAGSSCTVDVTRVDGEVAAVTLTGDGTASTMRVTADVRAAAPSFDTGRRWRTRIKGFARKNETTIRAPDLAVSSVSCVGGCRTNQSDTINVSVTVANFNTSSNSGPVNQTAVNVTNTSLSLDRQASTGDIPSGNTSATNVSVTVSKAGNFTFDVTAFDRFTGSYTATDQFTLHVRDTTPPNASGLAIKSKNVYINDTVPIEVDARDNLGVETINVTLRNATGALVNATMDRLTGTAVDGTWRADFNRTQAEGFYNLTKLFVHDTYGNLNVTNVSGAFEVGRLSTTIDASPQSTSIDDNVVIGVNVSGNITRTTDVVAKITKPRSYVETVDMQLEPEMASEYAVVYGNTSRSGSYDVNVSVTAGVTVSNMARNLFAIDFGQLAAEPLSGNGTHLTLPLDTSPYQLSWSITPDTGDLIDVWANASVNNTSVIELQDATPGRDVGNVTYEAGDTRVTYGLNGRDVGSTVFNLSVNASNGDQQLYVPINVTVVGEDAQAPNITSYDESPSEVNKNQPVTITATVEENSIVKNLTLVVQHPVNGSNYTEAPVAMEQVDRGTYRYRFTNTSETGHYTYRIRAWDIALNNDTIHSNSFDVKEQFSVNVTSARQLFKKADTGSFDITVRDVNGDVIDGYNTTIVMDKAGTNVTMFDDGFKDLFKYTFKRSDPPSPVASEVPKQYTLYVNVSKAGNIGRTAYTFNVTRLLDVSFLSPEQGDTVAPGSEFRLRVNITGPNGEVVEGIMYARCEQCPSQYKFLNFAGGGVFVQNFTAPQDDDSALIRVFASDLQGNTESQDSGPLSAAPAITINVGNESGTGGTGAGGGGGGGGGFGTRFQIEKQSPQQVSLPSNTSQVNLSVSTNLAASCRYTNRSLSIVRVDAMNRFNRTGGTLHWAVVSTQPGRTYRYNVFCQQSTGGNATLEVVFSIEPETVASFGLFIPDTIPPDGSGVEQGSVGKAPFSIYNNGSESIQIDVDAVVRRCCSAWISNESTRVDTVTLTPGSEKSLTINVDVPLNTSLGSYTAGLSFASGGRVREKTVQMRVVKGTDIRRLENLKQRAQQLVQQIRNYRRSGINTSALMQDYQRLQKLIGYAEQAVAQDDRQVLANILDQADTKANEIKGKLRALAFKNYVLENWWKWLFGGIAIYTLFFLLTMVAVPYYRLRTDYLTVKEKLESATQARKKAERQYFKRQIDRDTFMDIMTERQDEILELRSERDELQEELDTAIKSRLTAENYIKAPIKAVREINRWIESRRNKMVAERESSE